MTRKEHGVSEGSEVIATATAHSEQVRELSALATPPVSVCSREAAELPPALLKRYQIIKLAGQGGMSRVYRARDRQLGRDVALKVLFDNDGTRQRFVREARAQARLNHDNACKVFEVGVEQGKRYIVMQYIAGVPLDQLQGRIGLEDKVQILRSVALALQEAHRLGIVHRDVKPRNVTTERD